MLYILNNRTITKLKESVCKWEFGLFSMPSIFFIIRCLWYLGQIRLSYMKNLIKITTSIYQVRELKTWFRKLCPDQVKIPKLAKKSPTSNIEKTIFPTFFTKPPWWKLTLIYLVDGKWGWKVSTQKCRKWPIFVPYAPDYYWLVICENLNFNFI